MGYVCGTKARTLLYWTSIVVQLVGYMDDDWARNAGNRRSTFWFMFTLGSVTIVWSSKKYSIVALSSTESQYRGATVATCEAIWLKRILKDL